MYNSSVLVLKRIVVLGKTGAGKSSLANTIFGETAFKINHTPKSGTSECQGKNKSVNGKTIMWIDTPGFFDTYRSEEEMKAEIVRCITECAPGPHVFLIVLKVEKFTEQEKAVIQKLHQYFSEEALKYTIVVFTHGDQLLEEMRIEEFANESEDLSDLLKKCEGRCHVIDNKYWKNSQQDQYRSNQFQVAELLNTIDKVIEANRGSCYTNEMLQAVQREIQQEQKHLFKAAGVTTGVLLGAFLGGAIQIMKDEATTVAVVLGAAIGAAAGIAATGAKAEAQTPSVKCKMCNVFNAIL
uniref:AIG1-type G domain-containing protein n=1 Tax=Anabas testudineus TaxID=64144 RepID=A0A3Q1JLU2_ANATE